MTSVVIVGPTASGKTALSIDVAKKYNGEIIAADSRTVYKYMNIGTAKPSLAEQQEVPHWGIDIAGPGQVFSVADFKAYADGVIADISAREKIPVIVGGTGLYIDAVVYDYSFVGAPSDKRAKLSGLSIDELQNIIIKSNLTMPSNNKNKRHLISAIERDGRVPTKHQLPPDALIIGLNPDRDILRQRVVSRARAMIAAGVLEEVSKCAQLYGWDSSPMSGGIYKALRPVVEGKIDMEEAIENFITSDMYLAKRQMTWFKRNKDIKWFDNSEHALSWLENMQESRL